ncbi:hypothetical protein PUN28_016228 [Cardiocondyla obscurior]|uniref:Uncharacterized protein n=1 Tax=Cardiocondyla obscurior TaxID=286306 RepID=A0AAW2ETV7_9HYME
MRSANYTVDLIGRSRSAVETMLRSNNRGRSDNYAASSSSSASVAIAVTKFVAREYRPFRSSAPSATLIFSHTKRYQLFIRTSFNSELFKTAEVVSAQYCITKSYRGIFFLIK